MNLIVLWFHTHMFKFGFRLLLFLFLSSSINLFAQKIIVFNKKGKVKRVRFFERDPLSLELMNGEFVSGQITRIQSDSIKIGNKNISPSSVKFIYLKKGKRLLNTASSFLITGGLAYFPIVTFNRAVNDDSPLVEKSTIIISGGMLLSGVLLESLNSRKFKISEKRPLKIIDISP